MIEIFNLESTYFTFLDESLPDSKWITMFVLGLAMGLRHATDADHVVAVTTIVNEYKNAFKGVL